MGLHSFTSQQSANSLASCSNHAARAVNFVNRRELEHFSKQVRDTAPIRVTKYD